MSRNNLNLQTTDASSAQLMCETDTDHVKEFESVNNSNVISADSCNLKNDKTNLNIHDISRNEVSIEVHESQTNDLKNDNSEKKSQSELPMLSNFQSCNINANESCNIEDINSIQKSSDEKFNLEFSDSLDNSNDFLNKGVEFFRDIEIESRNIELKLSQHSVGDVGCVVWDAGLALAKYIDYCHTCNNLKITGKSAVDIGSGTGIVGLCAAALGANVVLTDLPDVMPQIERNIELNKEVLSGSTLAQALIWGETIENLLSPDIIFASDCIYYDMSVTNLIPTLVQLSSEHTDLFISYEDRETENKKNILRSFLQELSKHFTFEMIPKSQQHPDYYSSDIYLLKCKLIMKNGI